MNIVRYSPKGRDHLVWPHEHDRFYEIPQEQIDSTTFYRWTVINEQRGGENQSMQGVHGIYCTSDKLAYDKPGWRYWLNSLFLAADVEMELRRIVPSGPVFTNTRASEEYVVFEFTVHESVALSKGRTIIAANDDLRDAGINITSIEDAIHHVLKMPNKLCAIVQIQEQLQQSGLTKEEALPKGIEFYDAIIKHMQIWEGSNISVEELLEMASLAIYVVTGVNMVEMIENEDKDKGEKANSIESFLTVALGMSPEKAKVIATNKM